ncbi:MAG: N-acetyltransferase [Cellulosilyticaceae bacterium]
MTFIRSAESKDAQAIQDLLLTTFNTSAEADLVDRLKKTSFYDRELSFVAINEDKVIGYILFSRVVIKNNKFTFPGLILSPYAVSPEFQNQGIGRLLIETGIKKCNYLGYKIVFATGNDPYFSRFGFKSLDNYELIPTNKNKDIPLVYVLNLDAEDIKGTIHYPIEFA